MLNPELEKYRQQSIGKPVIEPPRQAIIEGLSEAVSAEISRRGQANIIFICTHNSRRSQFAQLWLTVAATHFGLPINCYSGGTEVSQVSASALAALKRAGFTIEKQRDQSGKYLVDYSTNSSTVTIFSKLYDHPSHPSRFIAVMTCSDADANCPVVPGAASRFSLTYEDPKLSDGTDAEVETYEARCLQIAREMDFLAALIANQKLEGRMQKRQG